MRLALAVAVGLSGRNAVAAPKVPRPILSSGFRSGRTWSGPHPERYEIFTREFAAEPLFAASENSAMAIEFMRLKADGE
jgi:hypothetical protein